MTAAKRIAERIRQHLDPLRGRLRRRELREVAGAIARAARRRRDLEGIALALALIDRADAAADERARRQQALDRLADALAAHGAPAAPALLEAHLRDRGAPASELAALARHLDADAVAEKEARAIGRLDGARELCLAAAGSLAAEALVAGRVDGSATTPPPLAPEAALIGRVVAHALDVRSPWTVRVAALDAVGRLLGASGWPATPALIDSLDQLADDAADHRWVQVAAVRALAAADPARARARARARLLQPRAVPDDFIVRARLVRLLTGELHDPTPGVVLLAAAADPSEHVRQSTARACRASGDPACRTTCSRLVDPAREASPRVRAVAAQVLADRACGTAGDAEEVHAADVLAQVICVDPDPLPRRVASDAAAAICADPEVDARVVEKLLAALDRARRQQLPAPLANVIARAAERAHAHAEPALARVRAALAEAVSHLRERDAASLALPLPVSDEQLGRVLASLAQEDFGLYATRDGDVVTLRRGEKVARRAWRVLHELRHPIPSKRQGYLHTIGRQLDAPLRAHPGGLAEVTRTRVPGERVFVASEGGWAPYLPLVDDLLSTALAGDAPAHLYSEHGCTVVVPPRGLAARLAARAAITARYAELADLRLRTLEARDTAGRGAYAVAVDELGFELRFEPYPDAGGPSHVRALFPRRRRARVAGESLEPVKSFGGAPLLLPGLSLDGLGEITRVLGDRGGGGVAELAAFVGAATAVLTARSLAVRLEIGSWRASIPLVVGGWGTRGKSGVERLKAALFHGLGYEVVSKTTGCEATVLVGVPGRPLVEVPLYRPYEKATIWEQRDVLRFAAARAPHVLLWECMALNPRYVDLLQRGWMRDDVSTLTNAYPDHEDIQGPTGLDVARVIAGFTPREATLVTTETQMLPVIRDRARAEQTRLVSVPDGADELLPPELLARFPYQEHPRNIALVMRLAEELGLDPEVALVEMADHVLADVGGLKTYAPLPVHGRRLRFTNGMSANERASALGNWTRLGFHRHLVDDEPGRWIVGFVNNRADRAARTLTFAEAIVEDLAAHRFVLVGTNTGALRREIDAALGRRLARLRPAEVPGLLAQLKIGAATVDAATAEAAAWLAALGSGDPDALAARLRDDEALARALRAALAAGGIEPLAEATRAVEASGAAPRLVDLAGELGLDTAFVGDVARFAVVSWARRRLGGAIAAFPSAPEAAHALGELFRGAIVEPADPMADADVLLDDLARACPPGALVDAMGLQNIKGPGLAVVQRFAAAERALADIDALGAPSADAREAARRRLLALDGVGAHVLALAADRLAARATAGGEEVARLEAIARVLRGRAALARGGDAPIAAARGPLRRAAAGIRRALDHLRSQERRKRADALFTDLARGRIAGARAARELERLLDEQRR